MRSRQEKQMSDKPSTRMPAIFFGHGSPMNALQDNSYTRAWRQLGASIPKPRAILAISAHWYTHGTGVTAMPAPRTIHDFGGFPQALFDMQYPAPGDPALAARICDLLKPIDVQMDHSWGLDHGTWSVLVKAYPDADVPVVQMSMDGNQPPSHHFEMGRRLAALREEGVLIIGTGDVVHNLRVMARGNEPAYDWAVRFNARVRDLLVRGDVQQLVNFQQWDDDARLSVPTAEHFLPLLYIAGAKQDDEKFSIVVDGIEAASISMMTAAVGLPDSVQ
jgi:4,5-DOPA dioxygenase extradiol